MTNPNQDPNKVPPGQDPNKVPPGQDKDSPGLGKDDAPGQQKPRPDQDLPEEGEEE